ncbi:MAG: arsenite methyltransferase, partial [Bacteroidales bacterium]|nr:arsenite methyltransferase [Bacteroidales bacterium]
IKEVVKEKYSHIARHSDKNPESCCGGGCADDFTTFSDSYEHLEGYEPDADLGLGCGIPTQHSDIKPGDTVVDLGSGAGNDCFVARALVGENGRVIGLDFSDDMLAKANKNALKMDYTNVEFIQGDIEDMPLNSTIADVVVSNCVLNLVPDKQKAFSEIFRILKPGGHFCISDVVLEGELPDVLKYVAEMYAGCISGALPAEDYMKLIEENGFTNIRIAAVKPIHVPDEILLEYISNAELFDYKTSNKGIKSITVYAERPL